MIYFEKGYILYPEDLIEFIDEEVESQVEREQKLKEMESMTDEEKAAVILPPKGNQTIDRQFWIEAKTGNGGYNIWPCFLTGYSRVGEAPNPPAVDDRPVIFYLSIVQIVNGHFGLLEVGVKQEELGVTKRIWNLPANKSVREETPWVAVGAGAQ